MKVIIENNYSQHVVVRTEKAFLYKGKKLFTPSFKFQRLYKSGIVKVSMTFDGVKWREVAEIFDKGNMPNYNALIEVTMKALKSAERVAMQCNAERALESIAIGVIDYIIGVAPETELPSEVYSYYVAVRANDSVDIVYTDDYRAGERA